MSQLREKENNGPSERPVEYSPPPTVRQLPPDQESPTGFSAMQSGIGNAAIAAATSNSDFATSPRSLQFQTAIGNSALSQVSQPTAAEPQPVPPAEENVSVLNAAYEPTIASPETAPERPLAAPAEALPVNKPADERPEGKQQKEEATVAQPEKPTTVPTAPPVQIQATTAPNKEPTKKPDDIGQAKAPPPEPVVEAKAEAKPEKAAQKIKTTGGGADKEKKEGSAGEARKGVADAGTTEAAPAGGAEGGAKEAKPADVKIKPGDPGEMLTSLGEVPPSQAVEGMKSLRGASATEFTREREELAENPPTMARPSGLPRKPAEEKEEGAEDEAPEELVCVEAEPEEQTKIETETPPIQEPLPVPSWIADAVDEAPEEDFAASAWKSLLETPVTDENVDTGAGPRPTVDLTGEADPQQISTQVSINRATFDAEQIKATQEAAQDWGEYDIFPVVPEEDLIAQVKVKAAGRTKGQAQSPKGIPADGLAAFDQAAAEQWSTAITDAQAENAQAADERSERETSAQNRTAKEIAALEAGTVDEQTNTQLQAQKDVNAQRLGWSDELTAADTAYTKKQTELETQTRTDISTKKTEADEGARKELDVAEVEAANKKRQAEEDAAKERAKAKKSSGGFFGWLKSKAKALINAIRSAINFIFDQLRKAVKYLIDRAKKAAMWLIDRARDAIVGLIHAFGAALEQAADVFLFAFPNAKKKFKSYIRSGVATAENAVNYAADKLKEGVCAALDALGAALDYVLELYQRAYNAILDAVEFIVIKMIEILEGIARLAESASMVGDYFIGQIEEEGIGMDLTQPLPIEKSPTAGNAATTADTAIASGALSTADASVLKKSTLGESDVAMSHVARLKIEPALLASIPALEEGEEYYFGDNDKPENESDAVIDDAAASAAGGFTPAGPTVEGGNGAGPTPAPAGPDVANMTPDQQLEYLENQEMPHTCGGKKDEEPAQSDAVPDHMRIYGPFTSSQRFSYMWGMMKKGISQWWDCNKVKIIIALAVAALITLLLGVLTGGAIFAAIPPLLTIIAAILIGVAIIKAASYVGDFIKLAWNGDLQGGAKALARGFAILTIELVFALLFNIGSIIKVIKSGLKATAKAAAGVAKTFVKSTVKAVQELGAVTKTIVRAGIKNSKLIIQGFKNGFGEGVKTIKQLTVELLSKSRFRGFKLRRRGGAIQLWGRFNPWVLLASGDIEWADKLTQAGKYGEKVTGEAGGKVIEGLLVKGSKARPDYRHIADVFAKQSLSKLNVIHHAVEQQVLKRFPGVFKLSEIHAGKQLRAILRGVFNSEVHLSRIRVLWNNLYSVLESMTLSKDAIKAAILNYAKQVDTFIEAMAKFMKESEDVAKALAKNDQQAVRDLLEKEAERLLKASAPDPAAAVKAALTPPK